MKNSTIRLLPCATPVRHLLLTLAAGTWSVSALAAQAPALWAVAPRCEGACEPVGLRCAQPRFSWGLDGEAPAKGSPVADVRVLEGARTVWTGRSSDPFACVYAGPALRSGTRYTWQVRLDGGAWSAPQRFSIALQSEAEWQGAQWIGEPAREDPVAWTNVDVRAKVTLVSGTFGLLARAEGEHAGYALELADEAQAAVRIKALGADGSERVLASAARATVFPKGFDKNAQHDVRFCVFGTSLRAWVDGREACAATDATRAAGTVGVSARNGGEAFVSELAVRDDCGGTHFIDRFQGHQRLAFRFPKIVENRLQVKNVTFLHQNPIPKRTVRLRKKFALAKKPVAQAFASVCGLGFYELWLNGAKADPRRVLAPGWTGRSSLFDTYDVTDLLKTGADNAVGLWLAPGYSDDFSFYAARFLKPKRAILHLAVTYADGTRDKVVTDGSWTWSDAADVPAASIYHGETIDARGADPAWCCATGSRAAWRSVLAYPQSDVAPLRANDEPPVRMSDPRRPVKIVETKPGVFVADFGQNRAGFVQAHVRGPRGTVVTLHTSELVGPDGNIDPWTNRRAKSTDTFVLAGTGMPETFLPRFTYHGFQYVEITGWPGRPTEDDLTGWAVHADVLPAGSFVCDHPGLNAYVNAANWSMRSNFMSFPTDCSMRDERTACQMDSQAYDEAALTWFELARYYAKWLDDTMGGRGNPDWSGDTVTLPWRLYRATGDLRALAARYDDMKGQVDDDVRRWPDLICPAGFGDWCAPNDGTWKGYHNDVEIVNTSLFCDMCRIVAETAATLGKRDEAARYGALSERARKAFHARFYHPETATYGDGSQTTSVLPLALGVVPEDCRKAVAARLVETIRTKDKSRVNVGIYGMRYLGDVLCDLGEADLFVTLMTQPEYPGFGFMFAQGATTLWEQWSFRGGMNTHNHAMFSGALHTLMTRLGGIRAAKPGFEEILIAPVFPKSLKRAACHRDTPRGRISVAWRREGGRIVLDVEVPPCTPATLRLAGKGDIALKAGRTRHEVAP